MKPIAIVYCSQTGHTRKYAMMLGNELKLPVYALTEARKVLPGGNPVVFLGWLFATHIKGYAEAARRYALCGACGVGLCKTGTLTWEVRRATGMPKDLPLFTLEGGMNRPQLRGFNRLVISILRKSLAAEKNPTLEQQRMLKLMDMPSDTVDLQNLQEVLAWAKALQ